MKCETCPYKETELECQMKCESKISSKEKKAYRIPKVSKKRKEENTQYSILRTEFLSRKENQICPITKEKTTDVHHKKGRIGSLFLDTKFWLAVSRRGHRMIEENPEWAIENGYSLSRLQNELE